MAQIRALKTYSKVYVPYSTDRTTDRSSREINMIVSRSFTFVPKFNLLGGINLYLSLLDCAATTECIILLRSRSWALCIPRSTEGGCIGIRSALHRAFLPFGDFFLLLLLVRVAMLWTKREDKGRLTTVAMARSVPRARENAAERGEWVSVFGHLKIFCFSSTHLLLFLLVVVSMFMLSSRIPSGWLEPISSGLMGSRTSWLWSFFSWSCPCLE